MQQSTLRQAPRQTPMLVWGLALLALAAIVLPILALGARVPWDQLGEILASASTQQLLRVTLRSAVLACVITLLLGTPLALWMQHLRRGAGLARVLVLLPLAMPPVVGGLALSAFLGRRGLAAPLLDALHIQFAFAFPGVVAAHVFIALPFVVITLDAALRQLDPEITYSAAGVGLSPSTITRKIILPAIAPSLVSAGGLAFARSLGEFGTTLTFAGSMPGTTRTMPLGIYIAREVDQDVAYGLSAILIALAVLTLAASTLPTVFLSRTRSREVARATHEVDTERLRLLTSPEDGGVPVVIGETTFPANATTALIGLNGSGKTTLVGRIAGRLGGLRTLIGDRVVDAGTSSSKLVPAHKRGVVLLTQNPGLPPTSTPLKAVAMVTGSKQRALELLTSAGLRDLVDVPVRALSGGQASQVSLVRALAPRPRVLILDEPLAAIDVNSAHHWRQVLRATAHDRTTIVITHNPLDVANLAEYVAVMDRGNVISLRPTAEELKVPATQFSARLAGVNWLPASVNWIPAHMVGAAHQGSVACVATTVGELTGVASEQCEQHEHAVVVFAPQDVSLHVPAGAAPGDYNSLEATVATVDVSTSGGLTVELDVHGAVVALPVQRQEALDAGIEPGASVTCYVKTDDIAIYPKPTD
ncbi:MULTISPECIES: ATP-binding cassette domain-containing protein [unclassified Corynebacterium]|uniref:ATP-binding cassette domain-containing protein n=1 Tax=unclassified Corynebacterium TaxID=2624378 RepID=UPI0008A1A262|nr:MULTISPECIES: ATP-binding cassette domain-containing protein [unclassified Corynebacterium]MDK8244140.1 ATP-binding cassette domain-containing protein [Corynebacterium sp. UMB10321]OFT28340.1 ABC transporter [Corynebacterium sp. HMSC08D02]